MKICTCQKSIFIAFLIILYSLTSIAQEKIKFGDVPIDDLKMMVYPTDTSAVAAVLHRDYNIRYGVNTDFVLYKQYTIRIKILKSGGLDYADFSIPFNFGNSNTRENLTGISGYTYNLDDNGKVERTKLSKEYIFEEKTSDTWRRKKIAFPNVKPGSIIELKYEITSPRYYDLDDYEFQSSIPVRYSCYSVTIPEYFRFSKYTMGYESIKYTESNENMTFLLSNGKISCSGKKMIFEVSDIPALKGDGYVWNKKDFTSKVCFNLAGLQVPGALYKNYAVTWDDVDKQLIEHESFGKQFRFSNLLKDEMAELIKPEMSAEEKMTAILKLVKQKIKWDEENTLWSNNLRKALKEGLGSSAEMNALLICLLNDAGFEAFPVVMSLRSQGRIFTNQPSLKKLNYFIAAATVDGKTHYMDASTKYGAVNVLHTECMVENARIIQKDKQSKWVDLQNVGKHTTNSRIVAKFNDDGALTGQMYTSKTGVPCLRMCQELEKQKEQDKYETQKESDLHISISDLKIEGYEENSLRIKENFNFEHNTVTLGDDYIYINPLIFPVITENQFKAETRVLPVEFPYPYTHTQMVNFTIPENYVVDELPKDGKISLNEDGDISFTYLIKHVGNMVQISQTITMNRTLYPAQEYEHLREFWAVLANKNLSQLVLKRVEK